MKRIIITIFAIVVVFTLSSASVSAQGVTGGLKAGMNIANMHGDNVKLAEELGIEFSSKIGLCAGGFITYTLNDMFAVQPEFLFSVKGAKGEGEIEGEPTKITMRMNYLEIPVLAKLLIPTPGDVRPSLFVGPSLAIKLTGKSKLESAAGSEEADIEGLKSTDFGLVFGGGIDFALGRGKFTVDARYTLGLITTREPEEGEEIDIKNGVISLMVGYSF
ncbi:MAG: PorT family protein [Elusimicrobiota bacterium]|nr:PorT family protein [Elusimicrobiota bacterium]MDH5661417.1 PorT family protein [Elusimicrobiota bacterium]